MMDNEFGEDDDSIDFEIDDEDEYDNEPERRYVIVDGKFRCDLDQADIAEGEDITVVIGTGGNKRRITGVLKRWYSDDKAFIRRKSDGEKIVVTNDEYRPVNNTAENKQPLKWVEYSPVNATSTLDARHDGEMTTEDLDVSSELDRLSDM